MTPQIDPTHIPNMQHKTNNNNIHNWIKKPLKIQFSIYFLLVYWYLWTTTALNMHIHKGTTHQDDYTTNMYMQSTEMATRWLTSGNVRTSLFFFDVPSFIKFESFWDTSIFFLPSFSCFVFATFFSFATFFFFVLPAIRISFLGLVCTDFVLLSELGFRSSQVSLWWNLKW